MNERGPGWSALTSMWGGGEFDSTILISGSEMYEGYIAGCATVKGPKATDIA